ncbi:UNVERIFIED_CONTAM: Mitochondrial ribosome-associated GTPase 2, partial [Eudyptes robustus]
FVDYRRVYCKAGNGGNGSVSFLREKFVEFGGPDGGNGGNGGHVLFKADVNTKDLSHIHRCKARVGEDGASKCCHGKSAEHLEVKVPLFTLIKDPTTNRLLHELSEPDQVFLAARGGAGGHGNHFYLSNQVRKPLKAELGGVGEEVEYALEMKVIATVGLIGFPNAGKSTLLRAMSRAKPKVASYPFTTLKPHIGIVHYEDYEQVPVADIPGLIEDAHKNVGLGFEFLKHVTRCHSLFYVLDYTLGQWKEQYDSLRKELRLYDPDLEEKKRVVIVNKVDLLKNEEELERIREDLAEDEIFFISAKHGHNLIPLMSHLRTVHDEYLRIREEQKKEQNDFEF